MPEDGMPDTATIHIVDDDPAVRDSLAFLLETAGYVVRTHDSAMDFLEMSGDGFGCVITDVRMPQIDGLELQKRLNERGSRLAVIVMTGHGDVPMAVQALKAGASDFLEKPFNNEALLDAAERAVAASRQAQQTDAAAREAATRLARLTAREREVLDGLVAGQGNKDIARDLGVSPRTVEVHRARVMEKMEARSLSDLVHAAIQAGDGKPVRGAG